MNKNAKVVLVGGILLVSFVAVWCYLLPSKPENISKTTGSFHVSVEKGAIWKEIAATSFEVAYSTKKFPIKISDNEITLRFNKSSGEYGDVEQVLLRGCGQEFVMKKATVIETNKDVSSDILSDDFNVVALNKYNLDIQWTVPKGCKMAELSIKANEYAATDKQHFNFPTDSAYTAPYTFKKDKEILVDGNIEEVQNSAANWAPLWTPATGHPVATTYIYVNDDAKYVYVSADITSDNTDDANVDWYQVTVANTTEGHVGKKYRVTDADSTYGTCGFGITNKVTYRHQTCELRIPKSEIVGDTISFSLQYYGTLGAPSPVITMLDRISVDSSNETNQIIIRGIASVYSIDDGTQDTIYNVDFSLYDLADGWSQVESGCTADDGAFDETSEPFTCEFSELAVQSPITINQGYFYEARASAVYDVNQFTYSSTVSHFFPVADSQEVVTVTAGEVGSVTGSFTQSQGAPVADEFMNGYVRNMSMSIYDNGSDTYSYFGLSCFAVDDTFDETDEDYTCALPENLPAGHYSITTTAWFDGDVSETDKLFQLVVAAPVTPTPTSTPSPSASPTATPISSTVTTYTTVYVTPKPTVVKTVLEYFEEYVYGEGKEFDLTDTDKVFFTIGNEEHSATVKEVTAGSAVVEIASTPQSIMLKVGETRLIDVTKDGKSDIVITLKSIEGKYAQLLFSQAKSSSVPITVTSVPEPSIQINAKEDTVAVAAYPWWIVAVGLVGISVVVVVTTKRREK